MSIIPQETLTGLKEREKDQAMDLFEQYRDVFAKDDYDLGKALDVSHTIETQGSPPIRSQPI